MKRILILIFGLILLVSLLAGCNGGNTQTMKASLNEEFTLPMDQTAVITGENLEITFDAVTADSRCPTGVTCIWAGEAKCQLIIKYNGSESRVVVTQSGGSEGFTKDFFNNYSINFKLNPYPEANKQIAHNDYQLVMKITK